MVELTDESVQCVVTSPPYWGLRKYAGNQELAWGGDNHCEHKWGNEIIRKDRGAAAGITAQVGNQINKVSGVETKQGQYCSVCNAWRGAYGLEPTVEMYVQHSIEILREIRRVLRKDGVCFWNIGDSYVSGKSRYSSKPHTLSGKDRGDNFVGKPDQYYHQFLKDKDLALIPFRVAISAQEDGWWVRSDIIWNKPNPMPESVRDRPTDAYEHILMLTKSAHYYWDTEAVKERQTESSLERSQYPWHGRTDDDSNGARTGTTFRRMAESGELIATIPADGKRNLRNVWTFPTQPYSGAHFATFPEKLPERCIKAASKEGDIVLDPFAGAGTTLKVAITLQRNAIGYELSSEYCELIKDRLKDIQIKAGLI